MENFVLAIEYFVGIIVFALLNLYIYDRFVQRKSSLLASYPIIGRFRYLFEILREPFKQYFGDEKFYETRDKIDWVYKASHDAPNFLSFSVSQSFHGTRFIIKNANKVLNNEEVSDDFSVTFGRNLKMPFKSKSIIARSGMSDGALSPEATRAFALGAKNGNFPINTGEGGLTSNYFFGYKPNEHELGCMEIVEGSEFQKTMFKITRKLFNGAVATKLYRKFALNNKLQDTYIMNLDDLSFFRPNWDAPVEKFPKEVPTELPDMILQVGSGLYGVRDKEGNFDPERYQKVMSFCRMTEVKIAQGAKQTGGKIIGSKVTHDIAYYRGVEPYKDLMSPNRFPYANTLDELFDFIGQLQELSGKPVGMKIVISDKENTEDIVSKINERIKEKKAIPNFITVDAGDGGSATAPLELMETVGLNAVNSLYLIDRMLRNYGIRDELKLIISGKILTPDDIAILMCLGADMTAIARGFMMSGGCIRARQCSGTSGHPCPVGMATQDKKKRAAYMVLRKASHITFYHNNLLKGIKTLQAVMGVSNIKDLSKKNLAFKNKQGEIYFDIEKYFHHKLDV